MHNAPDFDSDDPKPGKNLNLNSGISIAVVILLLSGYAWMSGRFSDIDDRMKTRFSDIELHRVQDSADHAKEVAQLKVDIADARRETADARREVASKAGDRWTHEDMYRWSVILQRANNDAGIKLVVPEPQRDKGE